MKTVYLIRGIPGSGKSTLANHLCLPHHVCEADDFFKDENGVYRYDHTQVWLAHGECFGKCLELMRDGKTPIAVANTFTRKWEMEKYFELAKEYGYSVHEIICCGRFKNVHGVPDDKVKQMLDRFEY